MIVTAGDGVTATVDPHRGGKIVSLRDTSGREWLAQASTSSPRGRSFVNAEMAGWDECAPSIVACRVDGRDIPDHGDLWDSEFESDGTTVRGQGNGYVLERAVEPAPGGIRLRYRAAATEPELPFLWAAHPQFAAPPGTRVVLPLSVKQVVDVLSDPPVERMWGDDIGGIDSVGNRVGRKFYVAPDRPVGEATLIRADGGALTMRWSEACPYLGMWFDNRAYSREPVIALEPSTGYYDSLATAVATKRVSVLRAGRPLDWWVDVIIS